MTPDRHPRRIVCLSTETCEVLYLLGESARIAGISGFTVHPPQARREKPRASGFSTARPEKILALEPDLVLAFSDLQADIAATLVRAGVAVHVFNQHTMDGILDMVVTLGALVGAADRAARLVAELEGRIAATRAAAAGMARRPRVYFEEWDEPLICGIGWVSELIAIAGGQDCFAELAGRRAAAGRVLAPQQVRERAPELIFGSWCGKRFRPEQLAARPGWAALPAVRAGQVFEIKSADILSPGPIAITAGLARLHAHIVAWARDGAPA